MKTKDKIIARINAIHDERILEEILKLVDVESEVNEIYEVSEEQKYALEEGLNDLKEGRIYSQKEVDEQTRGWLKNK